MATPTLLCLPPAGAQSLFFRQLAGQFPGYHVAALDLPGHGSSRVEPLDRVQDAATETAAWVRSEIQGPVLFLGHSYGAYVAYETIRQLQNSRHEAPLALAVVCAAAPGVPVLKELPASDAAAIELFSGHGGVPAALLEHPDLLAPAIALLRADLTAATMFSREIDLRTPLTIPSILVAGADDELVRPPMLGPWRRLLTDPASHVLPGGHFPPRDSAEELAALLLPLLDAVTVGAHLPRRDPFATRRVYAACRERIMKRGEGQPPLPTRSSGRRERQVRTPCSNALRRPPPDCPLLLGAS
jgi:surfactin synthase thioesterase subunit